MSKPMRMRRSLLGLRTGAVSADVSAGAAATCVTSSLPGSSGVTAWVTLVASSGGSAAAPLLVERSSVMASSWLRPSSDRPVTHSPSRDKSLRRSERLLEVGDQVAGVLDAHRVPDEPLGL